MYLMHRILKLLVISGSNFLYSSLAVKSLSNGFICLNELIKFFGELLILVSNDSNMIVERVDLNLEVRIVIQESRVAVSGSLKFLSHIHDLILFGTNLSLKLLDGICKFNISGWFRVDSLLEVSIFISILLLQALKVIQLVLEADHLILELNDFSFAIYKLWLFIFQIKGLSIDEFIKVIDSSKLFRDIILQGSCLCGEISTLLALEFILII